MLYKFFNVFALSIVAVSLGGCAYADKDPQWLTDLKPFLLDSEIVTQQQILAQNEKKHYK